MSYLCHPETFRCLRFKELIWCPILTKGDLKTKLIVPAFEELTLQLVRQPDTAWQNYKRSVWGSYIQDNGSTQEETLQVSSWKLTLEKSVMYTENYKDFTKKAPVRQMKSKALGSK